MLRCIFSTVSRADAVVVLIAIASPLWLPLPAVVVYCAVFAYAELDFHCYVLNSRLVRAVVGNEPDFSGVFGLQKALGAMECGGRVDQVVVVQIREEDVNLGLLGGTA